MLDFSNVKAITIPEGEVKQIDIGGVTVWKKPTGNMFDPDSANKFYGYPSGTSFVSYSSPRKIYWWGCKPNTTYKAKKQHLKQIHDFSWVGQKNSQVLEVHLMIM